MGFLAGPHNLSELHCLAHFHLAAVRLLRAHEYLEQGGLAHAVGADDADDAALRHAEADMVEQQSVTEALGQVADLDHAVAQARSRWNIDLVGLVAVLEFL